MHLKMKIAFIVDSFPKISETFILNQITGVIDMGHEVTIFAKYKPKEDKIHEKVKSYKLLKKTHYFMPRRNVFLRVSFALFCFIKYFFKAPIKTLSLLNFLKYGEHSLRLNFFLLFNCFEKKDFDVVHCQYGTLGFFGIVLKKMELFDGKLVVSFRGYDLSKYLKSLRFFSYKQLFLEGDIFLPVSNFFKKKLIEMGCEENKIEVHHSGIDLKKFVFYSRRKSESKAFNVLSIARLIEKKGIEYSVRAVGKALRKNPSYKIKYDVVGEGPLRKNLEDLAKDLNVESSIKFLGEKSTEEVLQCLRETDVLVAPSITSKDGNQEGIPNSIKEAMAVGVPVIGTQHSGIPELVINGKTGYVVPEKDYSALSERIEYLMKDPTLRYEMGKKGRKVIEREYDIQKLNTRLVEIYKKTD